MSSLLRAPSADEHAAMLALNNAFAVETSLLGMAALQQLIAASFHARVAGVIDAFCIALDQDAPYENVNFDWFRRKYRRFVYIDRIVVAAEAHGQGIGREIYRDLKTAAQRAGHAVLCCEVNLDPPNAASDCFHQALGFAEVGKALLAKRGKTVRYLALSI